MLTIRDTVVDPVLADVSIAYRNETYVAEVLMPVVPTKKQQGIYYVYDKANMRRSKTGRAAGAKANEVEYNMSTDNFFCKDHALKEKIAWEIIDQADDALDPEIDATESVTDMLLLDKEIALATIMADTAQITQNTTLSGTSQWSDYNNSNPIADVRAAIKVVQKAMARRPNTLVLSQLTYDTLIDHPDIVEKIKYTVANGVVDETVLARIFKLKNIVIADAVYNAAVEGAAESMDYIWGKHAWICYINPGKKLKEPTFGYTFTYKTRSVKKWDDEDAEARFVRASDNYVQKVVATSAVYLIKNATA